MDDGRVGSWDLIGASMMLHMRAVSLDDGYHLEGAGCGGFSLQGYMQAQQAKGVALVGAFAEVPRVHHMFDHNGFTTTSDLQAASLINSAPCRLGFYSSIRNYVRFLIVLCVSRRSCPMYTWGQVLPGFILSTFMRSWEGLLLRRLPSGGYIEMVFLLTDFRS